MPKRPAKIARLLKAAMSIVVGILIEFGFVFWFVIIAWGSASLALLLWQLVS